MGDEHDDRDALTERVRGRRVVLAVYLVVVGITGVMGALVGYVNPDGLDPTLFFVFDLPATILGTVVYGVTTVGVVLGVLLALVRYASRFDEERIV